MKIIANDYESKTVIKILREWSEKTQAEFAEDLGFSKMTIQSYERGLRRYSFETLMKIADKHNLTITIEKINVSKS